MSFSKDSENLHNNNSKGLRNNIEREALNYLFNSAALNNWVDIQSSLKDWHIFGSLKNGHKWPDHFINEKMLIRLTAYMCINRL